jgi:hypothetical protein
MLDQESSLFALSLSSAHDEAAFAGENPIPTKEVRSLEVVHATKANKDSDFLLEDSLVDRLSGMLVFCALLSARSRRRCICRRKSNPEEGSDRAFSLEDFLIDRMLLPEGGGRRRVELVMLVACKPMI